MPPRPLGWRFGHAVSVGEHDPFRIEHRHVLKFRERPPCWLITMNALRHRWRVPRQLLQPQSFDADDWPAGAAPGLRRERIEDHVTFVLLPAPLARGKAAAPGLAARPVAPEPDRNAGMTCTGRGKRKGVHRAEADRYRNTASGLVGLRLGRNAQLGEHRIAAGTRGKAYRPARRTEVLASGCELVVDRLLGKILGEITATLDGIERLDSRHLSKPLVATLDVQQPSACPRSATEDAEPARVRRSGLDPRLNGARLALVDERTLQADVRQRPDGVAQRLLERADDQIEKGRTRNERNSLRQVIAHETRRYLIECRLPQVSARGQRDLRTVEKTCRRGAVACWRDRRARRPQVFALPRIRGKRDDDGLLVRQRPDPMSMYMQVGRSIQKPGSLIGQERAAENMCLFPGILPHAAREHGAWRKFEEGEFAR